MGSAQESSVDALGLSPVRKKVIATGRDVNSVTPHTMQEFMDAMAGGPFDGAIIGFSVEGDNGVHCSHTSAANGDVWKKEWFASDVTALKAARSDTLTDNFFRVFIAPFPSREGPKATRMAWGDDARWAALANNLGVLAWVAKEGGLKGLSLDPEDYQEIHQFQYLPSDGDYEVTATLARERGRQVMRAMATEYPAITIWPWLFSFRPRVWRTSTPGDAVKAQNDLWIPFANGLLDELPPGATIADSNKSYLFGGQDFQDEAERMRNGYLNLVAPENRAKYKAQMQVVFGIYLDAHINPEGSKWYRGPVNGSRANGLRQDIADALDAADEYVWVYGEQGRWTTQARGSRNAPLWADLMPDVARIIELAKDPDGQGRRDVEALRSKGELKNLVLNAGFEGSAEDGETGAPNLPASWRTWQHEAKHQGVFSLDRSVGYRSGSSARAAGVGEGCLIQGFEVKPGEMYAIEAVALPGGESRCHVDIGWQTPDGNWTLENRNWQICFTEGQDDWQEAFGVVTVPAGVGRMQVLLGVLQPGTEDVCWFDNAGVYRLL